MIGLAEWKMRAELAKLWQVCFHEPRRYPSYFLNNYFRPEDCLVYQVRGEIAAAVYLLPARVALSDGTAQAHYIFAAGTQPHFRSRGFMASLLAYAALYGTRRGDRYSAVLPADEPLYSYYERNGYTDYYKIQSVPVSRARLARAGAALPLGRSLASPSELNGLRNSVLSRIPGSVLWSSNRFTFTAGFGSTYGDELVCSGRPGCHSYAFCRRMDENACSIREAMISPGGFPELAAAILKRFPAERYEFRLPSGQRLFLGEGTEERCGMIRPIGGAALGASASAPYLGLALD